MILTVHSICQSKLWSLATIAPLRAGLIALSVVIKLLRTSLTFVHQAFEKHVANIQASAEFKEVARSAQPFFNDLKDYVFGRPLTLENMVMLSYMFVNSHRSLRSSICSTTSVLIIISNSNA